MKELLEELTAYLSDCDARNNALYNKFGLQVGSGPPIGALGVIYNNLVIANELSSYYYEIWTKFDWSKQDQVERRRAENLQRLILVGKFLFISAVSACEWQAKEANKKHPSILELKGNRLYLRQIMERSQERALIGQSEEALWIAAIKVRNCLVHNNGFADETASWDFTPDLRIVFEDGKEAQATMMTLPRLTKWLYSAYAGWCDSFLTRAK